MEKGTYPFSRTARFSIHVGMEGNWYISSGVKGNCGVGAWWGLLRWGSAVADVIVSM